jgi:hypothetical protein
MVAQKKTSTDIIKKQFTTLFLSQVKIKRYIIKKSQKII